MTVSFLPIVFQSLSLLEYAAAHFVQEDAERSTRYI